MKKQKNPMSKICKKCNTKKWIEILLLCENEKPDHIQKFCDEHKIKKQSFYSYAKKFGFDIEKRCFL